MYHEFQDALLRSVLVNATCPYFILRVRRSPHLVHDTLRQVEGAIATDSLKKPLRVRANAMQQIMDRAFARRRSQDVLISYSAD